VCFGSFVFIYFQKCLSFKKSLQERSLDIVRALKSVTLGQSSLDCKSNVEQFNHQCFERSVKIYKPLDIEVKKQAHLNNNNGYDKIKVANGIQ
jgi:hypothetical protein